RVAHWDPSWKARRAPAIARRGPPKTVVTFGASGSDLAATGEEQSRSADQQQHSAADEERGGRRTGLGEGRAGSAVRVLASAGSRGGPAVADNDLEGLDDVAVSVGGDDLV